MAREEYDEREDEEPGGTRELSKKARRLQQRGWWTGGLALAATILLSASVALYFGMGSRGTAAFVELARLAVGDHRNCAIKFALAERPIPLELPKIQAVIQLLPEP